MGRTKSYLLAGATRFCLATALLISMTAKSGFAETVVEVGGEIESQEWTSDFVYHVVSDLFINPGIELIIRSGVRVKFMQGTGISVTGSLKVLGKEDDIVDSVYFQPLYTDPGDTWKWKGIQFARVQAINTNIIDHASIENTIIGLTIIDGASNISITNTAILYSQLFGVFTNFTNNILIANCRIQRNAGFGLYLQNSMHCEITETYISDNFEGLYLIASGADALSMGNAIVSNVIRNSDNINLFINNDSGGRSTNNVIQNNFIENSFIGIQLGSHSSTGGLNEIENNVIITDKITGRGIIVYHDTAIIRHNIFWHNKEAIILFRALNCEITNNSFYDIGYLGNGTCILINSGSSNTQIRHNTFTGNGNFLMDIREADGIAIQHNNFFKNRRTSNLLINNTTSAIAVHDNYWGTTNEEAIGQMLEGNFAFTPFLSNADTIAPVSPPQPAYKQLVDNKVRILWNKNPEQDLSGYRLHYGLFRYYQFGESIDAGTDTSIILDMLDIFDTIAITAYDSDAFPYNRQSLGHESPFSFPLIIPYAGPDTSICIDQPEYYIANSTFPNTYISLNWTGTGDGNFSNANELRTTYYPSQNDLENRIVKLTLQVFVDIGVYYTDSFFLSFLELPFAHAGNDTIIAADSTLHLIQAYASHYDSLLWTSTGNGTFDDAKLMNPVYTPGELDVLNAGTQLILHAFSACGIASDTLNIGIERRYNLEGRVWNGNVLLSNGIVMAALVSNNKIEALAQVPVEENGAFRFIKLLAGEYLLYAVPDTNVYPRLLPGYYVNKQQWQQAYSLPLEANTYDLDIRLSTRSYLLPHGIGRISGHFISPTESLLEENVYCADWFSPSVNKTLNCIGGVSNVSIMLFNKHESKLLDHTLTDASGHFSFSGLPFGDYIVNAEKAGYISTPSSLLTLSPQNPEISDVIIIMQPYLIKILLDPGKTPAQKIEVFPNPASSAIYLASIPQSGESITIEIRNIVGQRVVYMKSSPDKISDQGLLRIDIDHLNAGIYFGTLTSNNMVRSFSFVRN